MKPMMQGITINTFYSSFIITRYYDDPGGCWWPPTYSIWTPTTVFFGIFNFLNCSTTYYFLAVFRVLNFRSHFEALNDVFWGIQGQHKSMEWTAMDWCFPFQH